MPINKFTVLRDSREKVNYWTFRLSEHCTGTLSQGLKTGDYTLQGLEDKFVIERKGSVQEFANNLLEDRFERELVRLDEFPHSFIILEFTLDDLLGYPRTAKLPAYVKRKIKIRGPFLLKKLTKLILSHRSQVLFCGDEGQQVALQILKEVYERYGE